MTGKLRGHSYFHYDQLVSIHSAQEQLFFLGIPWDGAFVAAVIAAGVSAVGWYFTKKQIGALQEQTATVSDNAQRTEAFARWDRGRQLLRSRYEDEIMDGVNVLRQLAKSPHVNAEDRDLAISCLASYTGTGDKQRKGKKR